MPLRPHMAYSIIGARVVLNAYLKRLTATMELPINDETKNEQSLGASSLPDTVAQTTGNGAGLKCAWCKDVLRSNGANSYRQTVMGAICNACYSKEVRPLSPITKRRLKKG